METRDPAAWEQLLLSHCTRAEQAREQAARGAGVTDMLRRQHRAASSSTDPAEQARSRMADENSALAKELARANGQIEQLWAEIQAKEVALQQRSAELGSARDSSDRLRRQLQRLRLEDEALDWMAAEDIAEVQEELREYARRAAKHAQLLAARGPPPHEYTCPITATLMREPVMARDGHTYEKEAIERWFATHPLPGTRSPMTNEELLSHDLLPNVALRKLIADFRQRGVAHK